MPTRPPASGNFSKSVTGTPAPSRRSAATRPARPPPITATRGESATIPSSLSRCGEWRCATLKPFRDGPDGASLRLRPSPGRCVGRRRARPPSPRRRGGPGFPRGRRALLRRSGGPRARGHARLAAVVVLLRPHHPARAAACVPRSHRGPSLGQRRPSGRRSARLCAASSRDALLRRLPLLSVDPLDVRRNPPDRKADGLRRPVGPHDDLTPAVSRSLALRRALSLLSLRDVPFRASRARGPRAVGVRLQPRRRAPAGPRGARGLRRNPRAAGRPGHRGLRRAPSRSRRDIRRGPAAPFGKAARRPRLVGVLAARRQPEHDHRVAALHVPPRGSPPARRHIPVSRDASRPRGPHRAHFRNSARRPASRGRRLGEPVGPSRLAPHPGRREPRRARLQARVHPEPRDARSRGALSPAVRALLASRLQRAFVVEGGDGRRGRISSLRRPRRDSGARVRNRPRAQPDARRPVARGGVRVSGARARARRPHEKARFLARGRVRRGCRLAAAERDEAGGAGAARRRAAGRPPPGRVRRGPRGRARRRPRVRFLRSVDAPHEHGLQVLHGRMAAPRAGWGASPPARARLAPRARFHPHCRRCRANRRPRASALGHRLPRRVERASRRARRLALDGAGGAGRPRVRFLAANACRGRRRPRGSHGQRVQRLRAHRRRLGIADRPRMGEPRGPLAGRRLRHRNLGPQARPQADLHLRGVRGGLQASAPIPGALRLRRRARETRLRPERVPDACELPARFRKRRCRDIRDSEMSGAAPSSAWETPFSDFEKKAWIALLALSAFLHLVQLGTHAFHHDESIHAWAALHLLRDGTYKYDPIYHGPVQYYAVAIAFKVAGLVTSGHGESDFTARLPAALAGIALSAMALPLRSRFGRKTAFAAGALAAFSPNFLYYTRFCRDDVWSLLGTAGLFLWLDQYLRRGRLRDLCYAALSASVAFASKENFYVLLALMVPSVAAAWMEPERGFDVWNRLRRLIDWLEAHAAPLLGALLLFFCVSEVFYTVFLVHPESGNPVFDAISYWWGQHKMERVGGPRTFYLPRLLQYEFAVILPALALIATRWSRFTYAERFLTGWALSSVAMYAYLGEKAGWLIVHQVLPFIPLAGAAWALLAGKSARWRLAGAAMAAASLLTAVTFSFVHPVLTPNSRKAESTIQVQTCPEMLGLVDEILAYGKVGEVPAAIISGEAGWPMSWYLRDAPVNWQAPTGDLRPPIVLCDEGEADKQAEILGPAYKRDRVPFRAWWIPDTSVSPLRPNLRQLLLYVFSRETWDRADGNNPIDAVWVTVFRRTSGAAQPAPAPSPAAPRVPGSTS